MAQLQAVLILLARICIGIPFIIFGAALIPFWGNYSQVLEQQMIPVPAVFLVLAIIFLLLGGASLVLGYKTRVGAVLLLVALTAATFTIGGFTHMGVVENPPLAWVLWNNIALFGGLLYVLTYGPGGISMDKREQARDE